MYNSKKPKRSLGVSLPFAETDHLGHTRYAQELVERLARLDNGAAAALRGAWGRGKTDVLGRVVEAVRTMEPSDAPFAYCVSINPWKYARDDLLTPLVDCLFTVVPADRRQVIKDVANAVIRAGVIIGLRGSARLVGGPIAAEAGDFLASKLVPEAGSSESSSLQEMGESFAKLTAEALALSGNDQARILVIVDDIDRCVPERQLSLLEAIHFLKTADSRAVFLCAVDPHLLQQAVTARYGATRLDADAFLEKIFDLSQNLDRFDHAHRERYIQHQLDLPLPGAASVGSVRDYFRSANSDGQEGAEQGLCNAFSSEEVHSSLQVPRVVERSFRRLREAIFAGLDVKTLAVRGWNYQQQGRFAFWLLASSRYPSLRARFAEAGNLLSTGDTRPEPAVNPEFNPHSLEVPGALLSTFEDFPAVRQFLVQHNKAIRGKSMSATWQIRQWQEVFEDFGRFDDMFASCAL